MKRNYSLLRIAFVLAVGFAFLLPGSARAQALPDVLGHYRGFSQSIGDPDARGPVELQILSQTPDGEFQAVITILDNTYTIPGEVDANGNLEFGSGRTGVRGTGKWKDLDRGGALLLASYKLSSGDQGKVDLLRNFTQPPEPETPPDIAGTWLGTGESVLSLKGGTFEWLVHQDRTPTGAPGTGFMGQETVEGTIINDFVGTIDAQRADGSLIVTFVRTSTIASYPCCDDAPLVPPSKGFVVGGGKFESDELTFDSVELLVDGGVDLISMALTKQPKNAP